jgi:hypothetical protein
MVYVPNFMFQLKENDNGRTDHNHHHDRRKLAIQQGILRDVHLPNDSIYDVPDNNVDANGYYTYTWTVWAPSIDNVNDLVDYFKSLKPPQYVYCLSPPAPYTPPSAT